MEYAATRSAEIVPAVRGALSLYLDFLNLSSTCSASSGRRGVRVSLTRAKERAMRVIDCDCGATVQAANDDDLQQAVRRHVDDAHADMDMSDDQVRELVASKAYDASDS